MFTAQYCHNKLGNTLLLAHLTTGEYLTRYSYDLVIRKQYYYVKHYLMLTSSSCNVTSLHSALN